MEYECIKKIVMQADARIYNGLSPDIPVGKSIKGTMLPRLICTFC